MTDTADTEDLGPVPSALEDAARPGEAGEHRLPTPVSSFAITTPAVAVSLDGGRHGSASFSVSNTGSRELRGQAKIVAKAPATDWLTIVEPAERRFPIGSTEQYAVRIGSAAGVPLDAPPGQYTFRLAVRGVANPDEEYAESQAVTFAVPELPPAQPPKAFPWWIVGAAVAVVLVLGVGVAFLVLHNVTVPTVVGLSRPRAEATLQAASLKVGTISASVTGADPDMVLQQHPLPGTPAPRNSQVDLVVEGGRIAAPDVRGMTQADAAELLTQLGLQLAVVGDQVTGAPPGTVLQQDPPPATPLLAGAGINLVVEAALVAVPDLRGKTRPAAEVALQASRLRPGTVSEQLTGSPPGTGAPPGTVIGQDPAPNAQAPRGSAVNLALEVTSVQVPDVRGRSQADAQTTLVSRGLQLGVVTEQWTGASVGNVVQQSPPPNGPAPVRSSVNLVVEARQAHLSVTFTRLNVVDDADPLGSGEVWLDFNVNGLVGRWPNTGTSDVSSGGSYALNKRFDLTLNEGDVLSIRVNGTDEDTPPFDPNDALGTITDTFVRSAQWGRGSHQTRSTCPDGCYVISYMVEIR
jgi:beta-lactam-binding protein with PASTA domain